MNDKDREDLARLATADNEAAKTEAETREQKIWELHVLDASARAEYVFADAARERAKASFWGGVANVVNLLAFALLVAIVLGTWAAVKGLL